MKYILLVIKYILSIMLLSIAVGGFAAGVIIMFIGAFASIVEGDYNYLILVLHGLGIFFVGYLSMKAENVISNKWK